MDESEARAKQVVEASISCSLEEWDVGGRQHAPDLRDTTPPGLSVEVKRWTCEAYQRALHQMSSATGWHADASLIHRWTLIATMPTTGSTNHSLPKFGTLVADARSLIASMLNLGLSSSDEMSSRRMEPSVFALRQEWRRILPGGGTISSGPVFSAADTPAILKVPGLEIATTTSLTGNPDPNWMVDLLQAWLDGDAKAANAVSKLGQSGDAARHVFLVLDRSHDSWWMLHHWGVSNLPTKPLHLPSAITQLWISGYGDVVWWFDPKIGWASANVSF